MKIKTILGATAIALMGTSALAVDLGAGFSLDNTITAEYSFTVDDFTVEYDVALAYEVVEDLSVYVSTTVDIKDVAYTGLEIGVEYSISDFSVYGKAGYDENWAEEYILVGASVSF